MPDDVLYNILDVARFAPERRQPPSLAGDRGQGPVRLAPFPRDLYLHGWYEYLAMGQAGFGSLGAGHRPGRRVPPGLGERGQYRRPGPRAARPGFAESFCIGCRRCWSCWPT